VIVMRIPKTGRYMLDTVLSFIGILMCFLLTWYGVKVVLDFIQIARPMSTVLMPPAWILYLIVPIGSLLLTIQFIRRTVKNFNLWKTARVKTPSRAV
jgi:TRAP-type C4-dicarboxylate transport system permease small subunit